jgi:hypothetical protein
MIKCALCHGRVRPPSRPWQEVKGGVHFYRTIYDMGAYAKWLAKLNKTLPFVHEACAKAAEPSTLPEKYIVALNLDTRVRQQQGRRS